MVDMTGQEKQPGAVKHALEELAKARRCVGFESIICQSSFLQRKAHQKVHWDEQI